MKDSGRHTTLPFGALALGALAVGILGYVGYLLYPRFDRPAVEGLAPLPFGLGASATSFFSPCAFYDFFGGDFRVRRMRTHVRRRDTTERGG